MKSSKRLKMNPRCLLLVNENGDFEVFPKEDEAKIHPHYTKLNKDIIKFFVLNDKTCVGQRHFRLASKYRESMIWDIVNIETDIIEYTFALTIENEPTIYYWENASYSEEEMLRIIKLRSFI